MRNGENLLFYVKWGAGMEPMRRLFFLPSFAIICPHEKIAGPPPFDIYLDVAQYHGGHALPSQTGRCARDEAGSDLQFPGIYVYKQAVIL